MGVRITENGIQPDPNKVEFVKQATAPTSKKELILFLSMIQSNSEFLLNLSSQTANLRALTQKHKKFIWTAIHQKEFEKIKQFHEDILTLYLVPYETTYLFVDAHCTGLGAVLAQGPSIEDCLPVAIASRATSKIEQRYPQLDLEGIVVDFGLRRFRHYLIGGPQVNVITDHKPLVSIFQNKRL